MDDYKRLKKIYDEIDALIAQNVTSTSLEFQAWRSRANRLLISHFGEKSSEATGFLRLPFAPSVYSVSTPKQEIIEACRRGLESCRQIFQRYLEQMEPPQANPILPQGPALTPAESASSQQNLDRAPYLLLSHHPADKSYGDALEKLFSQLGVEDHQLIYTSHPSHELPGQLDIYQFLKEHFFDDVFLVVLWSESYLSSPGCLNEMGAAWVTQKDYTNLYVPDFDFGSPLYHECAVDTRKMGAVLNGNDNCRASILQLCHTLLALFHIEMREEILADLVEQFLRDISKNSRYF